MAEDNSNDNSLLIELVKSVAVLTSKFDSFEKERSEDNVELKASIKNVDEKVEKLDAKFETLKTDSIEKLAAVNTRIDELQRTPLKDKADKWEHYTELVLKLILTAAVGVILVKVGLK